MADTGTSSPQPSWHCTILIGHVSDSCLARADATTLFLQALQTTGRIGHVDACVFLFCSTRCFCGGLTLKIVRRGDWEKQVQ